MQALQIFNYQNAPVRTVTVDGEPWFVAKDVAEILGYTWNGAKRIAHVPEEWRGVTSVVTPSGEQEMLTLSEQGLFFFLGRSDKPAALAFQKWVYGEVVPSIRKTGSYSVQRDPIADIDRLVPAIASGMGVIRQEIELVADRVAAVEERQREIDPQEIERRMRFLDDCKTLLVFGTKGKPQAVTFRSYWSTLKALIGINSFTNRAALTVSMMDTCVEYARRWCQERGVQPPSLFDKAATDDRSA